MLGDSDDDDDAQQEDEYQSSYIMGRAIKEDSIGTGQYIETSDGGYRHIISRGLKQ